MSCYFCNKEVIDVIVSSAITLEVWFRLDNDTRFRVTEENADTVGRALWLHCAKSVNEAYGLHHLSEGDDYCTRALGYVWQPFREIRPEAAYGACAHYRYQACETKDWDFSPCNLFVLELIDRIVPGLLINGAQFPWGLNAHSVEAYAEAGSRSIPAAPIRTIRKHEQALRECT